jgi:hypothetical protein
MQLPDAAFALRLDGAEILVSQYATRSTRADMETKAAVADRRNEPDDEVVLIWLQILDQEAARILGDDQR